MNQPGAILFHPARTRKRRERAARHFATHDFLLRQAATSLAESLESMTYAFPRVLEVGASGLLRQHVAKRPGTEHYWACDISPGMPGTQLVVNNELLPLAPDMLDAVLSAGGMHWINDLPGAFIQIMRSGAASTPAQIRRKAAAPRAVGSMPKTPMRVMKP